VLSLVNIEAHNHVPVVDDHLLEQYNKGAGEVIEVHEVVEVAGASCFEIGLGHRAVEDHSELGVFIVHQVQKEELGENGRSELDACLEREINVFDFAHHANEAEVAHEENQNEIRHLRTEDITGRNNLHYHLRDSQALQDELKYDELARHDDVPEAEADEIGNHIGAENVIQRQAKYCRPICGIVDVDISSERDDKDCEEQVHGIEDAIVDNIFQTAGTSALPLRHLLLLSQTLRRTVIKIDRWQFRKVHYVQFPR
jgi:hypothetical protein